MELTVICVFAAGWVCKKLSSDWYRAKKKRLAREAKRRMKADEALLQEKRHIFTWPQIMRIGRELEQCKLAITPSTKS